MPNDFQFLFLTMTRNTAISHSSPVYRQWFCIMHSFSYGKKGKSGYKKNSDMLTFTRLGQSNSFLLVDGYFRRFVIVDQDILGCQKQGIPTFVNVISLILKIIIYVHMFCEFKCGQNKCHLWRTNFTALPGFILRGYVTFFRKNKWYRPGGVNVVIRPDNKTKYARR